MTTTTKTTKKMTTMIKKKTTKKEPEVIVKKNYAHVPLMLCAAHKIEDVKKCIYAEGSGRDQDVAVDPACQHCGFRSPHYKEQRRYPTCNCKRANHEAIINTLRDDISLGDVVNVLSRPYNLCNPTYC